MSEKLSQTAEMLQRIHALEEQNKLIPELQAQLVNLQQGVVNVVASQIQSLFTNPVMVDSIAHTMLIAAANALAFKARASQDRAPELTVVEGYIPGALRAILNEDGSIEIAQQLKGAKNAGASWESANADFEERGILGSFSELLAAFGAVAGRVYYITDTVTLQQSREKLARELAAQAGPAIDEEQDTVNPADLTFLIHDEEGAIENGLLIKGDAIVEVYRGDLTAEVIAAQLEVGDKFHYTADENSAYAGVIKSIENVSNWKVSAENEPAGAPATDLPLAEPEADPASVEPGEGTAGADTLEPGEAPVDGGIALQKAQVAITFKPLPLSGEVDADAPTLTNTVDYDASFEVTTETGTVTKLAQDLERGDIVTMTRGGAMMRESVVAVAPVVQTAEAAVA